MIPRKSKILQTSAPYKAGFRNANREQGKPILVQTSHVKPKSGTLSFRVSEAEAYLARAAAAKRDQLLSDFLRSVTLEASHRELLGAESGEPLRSGSANTASLTDR